MRNLSILIGTLLLGSTFAFAACGDDDDTPAAGAAGTAGTTAGTAGTSAGTSGTSSGTSGTSSGTAGTGGDAGTAGTGGDAGTAGSNAGSAGSTAGTAGSSAGTAGSTAGSSGATAGTSSSSHPDVYSCTFDTATEQAAGATIAIDGFKYSPRCSKIKLSTAAISIASTGGHPLNKTTAGDDWTNGPSNDTDGYSFVPATQGAGTFTFECAFHGESMDMKGVIYVYE